MENLKTLAILIPILPLLGMLLVGAVGLRFLKDKSHWLVITGVGGSLVLACLILGDVVSRVSRDEAASHVANAESAVGSAALSKSIPIYDWFVVEADPAHGAMQSAGWLQMTFRVDQLTCVMLMTVLAVSFMVVLYSKGYMRDHHGHAERGYERFFAFLGLFVFSMCMLVLAGNFLVLYLGWELVGLSSYLLIGHYYQKPEAALAARKAFIVNRIGDFGFALGIWLIYLTFRTLDHQTVFDLVAGVFNYDAGHNHQAFESLVHTTLGAQASVMDFKVLVESRITWIALLLFCGAMGKSAQFPLHVWLPDAMEGPTPVSALIHAATMVTAGVYLVARCSVIFASSEIAMWFVAAIGAATAFFAATIAMTQFDMKRILAYSTLSQLGYMFMGLGVGAFDSSVFHLYTHAFFKACLFLGAGSVMHAMGGVIDIRRFSGLRKQMPVTHLTFLIASLALAGFPLLSAFWSKDEIIHAAFQSNVPMFGWIGLVTALLTAFYTFRMVAMAFWGPLRLPQGVEHAHEGGIWMNGPLVFLSIGAVLAGYVGVHFVSGGGFLGVFQPDGVFHEFLAPVIASAKGILAGHGAEHAGAAHAGGHGLMYASSGIAILGILSASYLYLKRPTIPWAIAAASGSLYRLVYNKYYVDEIYDAVFVQPLRRMGRLCFAIDRNFINAILYVLGNIPRAIGFGVRSGQQGAMQGYALGMVIGLVALIWIVLNGIG
ncbi:MAG: NADH-quinone oxidoreductase subunit L [Phycisphaerales bacterium]|nr:NADH-quinone oxidoreductase subunit L [Phycisphaerales bacterium]MCB9857790.1 NADH-quinone oxidoreductase subunit L [Phycisphaerales bacterium]MCB9863850.1 NADH-quinone oxidoreductase subunit L [Phycisphaerales bacterium]